MDNINLRLVDDVAVSLSLCMTTWTIQERYRGMTIPDTKTYALVRIQGAPEGARSSKERVALVQEPSLTPGVNDGSWRRTAEQVPQTISIGEVLHDRPDNNSPGPLIEAQVVPTSEDVVLLDERRMDLGVEKDDVLLEEDDHGGCLFEQRRSSRHAHFVGVPESAASSRRPSAADIGSAFREESSSPQSYREESSPRRSARRAADIGLTGCVGTLLGPSATVVPKISWESVFSSCRFLMIESRYGPSARPFGSAHFCGQSFLAPTIPPFISS